MLVAPKAVSACPSEAAHLSPSSGSIGRLVLKADFERVLSASPKVRSPHFVVHYVADRPSQAKPARLKEELFTGDAPRVGDSVDNISGNPISASASPPSSVWLGTVIPKRHARRAVTRTLLKRQIRAAIGRHAAALASGLWIVRLRAPFDIHRFPSAASEALKLFAREELDSTLARVSSQRR